ncbi:MAG: WecB/TagA/CpsF family glycosyltransferase [Gemmatimonadaceae bacterium]|nr:WecB/TagA/CpsF family glycosyltransferase [Gemmatimonadaceae bacterium]
MMTTTSMGRVQLGKIAVDRHTRESAVSAIGDMVLAKRGGKVFTPNLDHILLAERRASFRSAYEAVDLSLVDGMPLVWASHWFGQALPERISGSDLVDPVAKLAGERGWRVYLLGGGPGTAEEAGRRLAAKYHVDIAGVSAPRVAADGTMVDEHVLADVVSTAPDLVLVGLGSPKQEYWIDRYAAALAPAVMIGVGASLDFQAGRVRRAPRWIGRIGFEWLFRLVLEPRRLWRRYLVDGPQALAALARTPRQRPTA